MPIGKQDARQRKALARRPQPREPQALDIGGVGPELPHRLSIQQKSAAGKYRSRRKLGFAGPSIREAPTFVGRKDKI
jgi:hypothetical protein